MTGATGSPTDRRTLIRMLDGGRGITLLLLALLLLGIFATAWRDPLVLSVTGRPAEAQITETWTGMTRGRVRPQGQSYRMPEIVYSVAFTITEDGASPVAFQTRVNRSVYYRLAPGDRVPASRSRLWPDRIASVDPAAIWPRSLGWLAMALAGFGGLLWRSRALAREADRAIETRARGTPVAARIVSHRVHKGFIRLQPTLAWRSDEGESGATLPLPGNRAGLARRWPVTGTLTLWRHPDGRGRLWSEAELFG